MNEKTGDGMLERDANDELVEPEATQSNKIDKFSVQSKKVAKNSNTAIWQLI